MLCEASAHLRVDDNSPYSQLQNYSELVCSVVKVTKDSFLSKGKEIVLK